LTAARRLLAILTVFLVALLAAAAAAPAKPVAADGIVGTGGAAVPQIDWEACPAATPEEAAALADFDCATVDVPLSYRDPDGPSIQLALGRLPAADQEKKLGSVFTNPGGPGGPGRIPFFLSEALHQRFDFVGFDPRGIGESTPLNASAATSRPFACSASSSRSPRSRRSASSGSTSTGPIGAPCGAGRSSST
jgi:hypothetical protein